MKESRKLRKNTTVAANNIMAYACYYRCQCDIDCRDSKTTMQVATIGSTPVSR